MKRQVKRWSCGAAALRNALRALGQNEAEHKLRGLAGTSEQGTDEEGLKRAARALGYRVIEHWGSSRTESFDWLHGALRAGKPVVLCVDAWEHWVVAFGNLGDRICIYDSARWDSVRNEDGVFVLDRAKLQWRWWNARKSVEGKRRAYALAIYK